MSSESILIRIANNPDLPTPPAIVLQVLDRTNRPDCTLAEIGQLIARDPGLCGKILRTVNSALFNVPRAVTSIERALNLLGLKRVRALVLSLSLPSVRRARGFEAWTQECWKASVVGATVARELALRLRRPDPENELVAALLRDLGALILTDLFPQEYGRVLVQPPEVLAERQCELERAACGVSHAEVSAFILNRWRLPEELTAAILHHHDPAEALSGPVRERAVLLHFATRVAQLQSCPELPRLRNDILDLARTHYRMEEDELLAFLRPLQGKVSDLAGLLEIDIGTSKDYAALLANATERLQRMVVETSLENLRMEEQKNQAEHDKKQAEEALHKSEEKLRQAQKMEAVGRLAGGVAHDFNNLLTVINGYAEVLLGFLPAQHPARAFAEQIHKAGERASALTAQLLAFSRKQFLNPEPLDLNAVITNMHKMVRRLIGEDIELTNGLAPKLWPVRADRGQIEQVLLNLFVNARDAMPQGGKVKVETANVTVDPGDRSACEDLTPGPYVMLSLTDTGCGMTAEVKKHLFEPFFTTKEVGKGTGLGLATVYGIVKQTDGQITVASEVGKGTTFRIYLPRAGDSAVVPTVRPAAPATLTGDETILVAEDDDGVRALIRHALKHKGYRMLEAADGVQALAVSQQHAGPIHLLLTDTVMPRMNGRDLAERLVGLRPDVKILFMSGYTDDAALRHGLLNPGTPLLQKPFSPQVLVGKVREVLKAASPA